MDLFVLHQDELDHFRLQVGQLQATHLQNIEATLLLQHRGAHVEEALRVLEVAVGDVQFAQALAVTEHSLQGFPVLLLVEGDVRKRDLSDLRAELNTLHQSFEVNHVVLKFYVNESERFKKALLG